MNIFQAVMTMKNTVCYNHINSEYILTLFGASQLKFLNFPSRKEIHWHVKNKSS